MAKLILLLLLTPFLVQAQSLLKNLEEPFSKYKVSTTACTKILHTSGSIIFIPDHAFAVNTKEVDSVDVFYREIRFPIDMVVHNINMFTELMGKKYHLESNGMFEIYAKNENDTIEVHEDRSIIVRLAMPAKDIDVAMQGYSYNQKTHRWDSYADRVNSTFLNNNDNDLWGGSPISEEGNGEWVGLEEEWVINPELGRQDSIRRVAFQALEIFDFGLYNYDKIIEGEIFIPIVPSFVDQKKDSIISSIYVVYDNINSVFQYDEYNWKTRFSIIKDQPYKLFTIDKEGEIYSLKNYPMLTEEDGQQITFTLINAGPIPDQRSKLSYLIGVK